MNTFLKTNLFVKQQFKQIVPALHSSFDNEADKVTAMFALAGALVSTICVQVGDEALETFEEWADGTRKMIARKLNEETKC